MGIKIYNEDDHGGGFIGIRVVRMINGEYRQKYFSFRISRHHYVNLTEERRLLKTAKTLDRQWEKDQADAACKKRKKQSFKDNGNAIEQIGITGIRPQIYSSLRYRAHEYRWYYSAHFTINYIEKTKKTQRNKKMNIRVHGYKTAWRKAVEFYKTQNDTNPCDIKKLLKLMPEPTVFEQIRQRKNKNGHRITRAMLKEWGVYDL